MASPHPDSLRDRAELAAALTALRENAGLTVRELARRVDIPTATLGGYFSGRHLPSITQLPLLARALNECGVYDEDEIEQWFEAVRRARTNGRSEPIAPPYRGLEPFGPDDAHLFFGRAALTDLVLQRLQALRLEPGGGGGIVTVVGASGSGKSSLLRAGVAAAIARGALGAEATYTLMHPGRQPRAALERALAQRPGVLVIDQFEELFTSVPDRDDRARFLSELAARDASTLVAIGLRADFYGDAAAEPVLLGALQHAQIIVAPMDADDVRAAIVGPAEAVGMSLEPGLADVILADLAPHDSAGAAHDPGALPLLSHALLSTWERASGRRLTIADYRASGGIEAAVQHTAEEVYLALEPEQRDTARYVFLRLVNVDGDTAVTRRRVTHDELDQLGPQVGEVIGRFVERRLLTTSAETVEISHEALLTAWPRLRTWVGDDRSGLVVHRQITEAANAWEDAGRDPSMLMRGARLETSLEWTADATHRGQLNGIEAQFVAAGTGQRDHERRAEQTRARRRTQLFAAVVVLAIIASGLAIVAAVSRRHADQDRATATAVGQAALARGVAASSNDLQAKDPALAQQLAVAAFDIDPTDEARANLIDLSSGPVVTRQLGSSGYTPLAVSQDGSTAAIGDANDGSVRLYTLHPGAAPTPLGTTGGRRSQSPSTTMAFTPDGRVLVVGDSAGDITVWNARDPRHPPSATIPNGIDGPVTSVAISPDGHTLAAGSGAAQQVRLWDITDPVSAVALPAPAGITPGTAIQAVTFTPDGSLLAGGTKGLLYRWPSPISAPTALVRFHNRNATINALAYDRRKNWLLTGNGSGDVSIWNLGPRTPTLVLANPVRINTGNAVTALAVSPDGQRFAVGDADNIVREYSDSATPYPLEHLAHPGPIDGLAYLPHRTGAGTGTDTDTSAELISTAGDGALRLWNGATREIIPGEDVESMTFEHHDAVLALGYQRGLRLWNLDDPNTPRPLGPALNLPAPDDGLDGYATLSQDGKLAAAGTYLGFVGLWDESRPAHPVRMARFRAAGDDIFALAFNPTHSLLAVGSNSPTSNTTLTLWDVRNPARPRRLDILQTMNVIHGVAFSSDGALLAAASSDRTVHVWNVSAPARPVVQRTLTGFDSDVEGVAFSPTAPTLAATGADDTTRVWDLRNPARPRMLARLIGATSIAYSPSFSADGRTLAVASDDSDVRLYRLGEGPLPIVRLSGVNANAKAVALSPRRNTVVGGGQGGHVAVWTNDAQQEITRVCSGAGTQITRQEWSLYVPDLPYDPPCEDGRPTR